MQEKAFVVRNSALCPEEKHGELTRDTCGWTFEPVNWKGYVVKHNSVN